jgi:predicted nucleic acid-binding protein
LIAVDTSVVVAAFASWHEGHRAALECLRRDPRLPAHVVIETFSVITRLPAPHRAPGKLVAEFLRQRFRNPLLTLPPNSHLRLVEQAAAAGLAGGAIYDALIAATASRAGATLLSRDHRAAATYEALGVDYELVP